MSTLSTKWLCVGDSLVIKKKQIKECILIEEYFDRFNIICTMKDGRSHTILPIDISYDRSVKYLNDIHKQLENIK